MLELEAGRFTNQRLGSARVFNTWKLDQQAIVTQKLQDRLAETSRVYPPLNGSEERLHLVCAGRNRFAVRVLLISLIYEMAASLEI